MCHQSLLNGFHASIHHVRRGYHLTSCLGIGQCHLRQPLAALLSLEGPILTQKPAVTVGGVGAQADIAGHQEAREVLAQQTDRLDSWGVLRVGCRAPLILGNSAGDTEDQDAAQALFHQRLQHLFQTVHAISGHSWEAGDGLFVIRTIRDKDGVDEVGGTKAGGGCLPGPKQWVEVAAVQD